MAKLNRTFFFQKYKELFGNLTQAKVDSINFLLDKLDASTVIDRLSKYAYVLATIKWETADTFKPITELGSDKYLKSKKYYPYIGRGYVQLTWSSNYKKFGDKLGIDLLGNPKLANDPETAWKVLELGMTNSKVNFTGVTLDKYFNDNTKDWTNARRIINGTDSASAIGNIAKKFYDCLEYEETV